MWWSSALKVAEVSDQRGVGHVPTDVTRKQGKKRKIVFFFFLFYFIIIIFFIIVIVIIFNLHFQAF